jgi:hypothetical protein
MGTGGDDVRVAGIDRDRRLGLVAPSTVGVLFLLSE